MIYPKPSFELKICPPTLLSLFLTKLPKPLVFTNGCFDILHRGHITYLAQARSLGKALIVALNSDSSVHRQGKGDDRPINSLENRLALIAALESVDCVTWFDDDTPENLINIIKADVLVKGGDWDIKNIVGSQETIARGGQVHSIPFQFNISTSSILKRIRESKK